MQTAPAIEDCLQHFLHLRSILDVGGIEGAGFMHCQQVRGTQFDLHRLPDATPMAARRWRRRSLTAHEISIRRRGHHLRIRRLISALGSRRCYGDWSIKAFR